VAEKTRAWIAWSSGKDAAWALHKVRREGAIVVTGMLVTITDPFGRASMHAVREELVDAQAASAGIPLHKVRIPSPCSNEQYEALMGRAVEEARNEGVECFIFGDVFLEDVRRYREEKLGGAGMKAHFPLWGTDTKALAEEMISGGLKAVVTCIDPRKMPQWLAGADYDGAFLEVLPAGADPCGENGEFHTFAWDGPMFARPTRILKGTTVSRDGFIFTDVVGAGG